MINISMGRMGNKEKLILFRSSDLLLFQSNEMNLMKVRQNSKIFYQLLTVSRIFNLVNRQNLEI